MMQSISILKNASQDPLNWSHDMWLVSGAQFEEYQMDDL